MGRISSSEAVLSRAKANGYVYRAHYEEDSKIDSHKYVAKTVKDQNSVLRRYEMCVEICYLSVLAQTDNVE